MGGYGLTPQTNPNCGAQIKRDEHAGKGVIYRLAISGEEDTLCWRQAFSQAECGENVESCIVICTDDKPGRKPQEQYCSHFHGDRYVRVFHPLPNDPHVPPSDVTPEQYVSYTKPPGHPIAYGTIIRTDYALYHETTAQCATGGAGWHDAMSPTFGRLCWHKVEHNVQFCFMNKNSINLGNCSPYYAEFLFHPPAPPGPLANE